MRAAALEKSTKETRSKPTAVSESPKKLAEIEVSTFLVSNQWPSENVANGFVIDTPWGLELQGDHIHGFFRLQMYVFG